MWLEALQPTPQEYGLWQVSHDGKEQIARLEHMPLALLSKELHHTHMAIHGIMALPPDVPMASLRVEPIPEWQRERGMCAACCDGKKAQCDNPLCHAFDPPAVEANKIHRIKADLLPKCVWILKRIREREEMYDAALEALRLPVHGALGARILRTILASLRDR